MSTGETMAKKSAAKKVVKKDGVNKSQAIRDYLDKNKDATGPDAVEALAKQGVQVTLPLVYNVRSTMGTKKKATKKGPKGGHVSDVLGTLDAAKEFVTRAGGLEQAKAVLDRLA